MATTSAIRVTRALLVATAVALAIPGAVVAQHADDTVFIVPGGHLDLGYTAPIDSVRARRIAIIDGAMHAADPHFVWFEEGGWSVEAWLDRYHDDPTHIAQLRTLVMRGQIGIGATLLSPYAAGFPEALHLLTLHLDRVQRELGRRPSVAVVNDVPAVPEALVDALAAAGIRYLLMGPNLYFSAALPDAVTRDPFYWESSHGARVLVAIDPEGYGAAYAKWLLPSDCVRATNRNAANASDADLFQAGVARELAARHGTQPLSIIQHAIDNGDPACALHLDAAAAEWNHQPGVPKLVVSTPEIFFQHLEARRKTSLHVLHGEWGGEWDLLRASEPTWTWRLHRALRAVSASTPPAMQLLAATVTDHNVGLGTRWMDGLPVAVAREHVAEVATLYRKVVGGLLGDAALTSVPAAMVMPPGATWPAPWQRILGARKNAALVRAGNAFIYPFVADAAPVAAVPVTVGADDQRAVIRTTIDRVGLERSLGPKYQAVIEVEIQSPLASLTIAPVNSPAALRGSWLMGVRDRRIVSPDGVIVRGPGWAFRASGPLLFGWTLRADPANPNVTRLQALALIHSVEGIVDGGTRARIPFAQLYPGEPTTPTFDLELVLTAPHP